MLLRSFLEGILQRDEESFEFRGSFNWCLWARNHQIFMGEAREARRRARLLRNDFLEVASVGSIDLDRVSVEETRGRYTVRMQSFASSGIAPLRARKTSSSAMRSGLFSFYFSTYFLAGRGFFATFSLRCAGIARRKRQRE